MRGRTEAVAGLLVALVVIAALTWTAFWIAHWVEERERCDGLNASLCSVVRWSDERECRAGEGCGLPLESEPRR